MTPPTHTTSPVGAAYTPLTVEQVATQAARAYGALTPEWCGTERSAFAHRALQNSHLRAHKVAKNPFGLNPAQKRHARQKISELPVT